MTTTDLSPSCDPFTGSAPLTAPLGRQKTVGVDVGGVIVGGSAPMLAQLMTNTDTTVDVTRYK